jgi:hypothetical protein
MPIEVSKHNIIPPSLSVLILGDGMPKMAFFMALVVGTILTIINHGDILIAGSAFPTVKILLNYCVPYCVTTWGAVTGKRSQWVRNNAYSGLSS